MLTSLEWSNSKHCKLSNSERRPLARLVNLNPGALRQRTRVDNHLIGRLLRINEQIVEALQWSIDNKKLGCATNLRTIADAFAGVLADIIDKDAQNFIRRKKISLVKKRRR